MASLEVVNPVAHVSAEKSPLAPRLPSLDGKRIALYWNGKHHGDMALAHAARLLESRFKGVQFKLIKSGVPGPADVLEGAKAFDGVIASTGD